MEHRGGGRRADPVHRDSIQSVAFGFPPTRSLTLLVGAERSRTDDEIEFYPAGMRASAAAWSSSSARSCAPRSSRTGASRPTRCSAPARGVERPNVNELFPHGVDRRIVAILTMVPAHAFHCTGVSTHSPITD